MCTYISARSLRPGNDDDAAQLDESTRAAFDQEPWELGNSVLDRLLLRPD